MGNAGKMGMNVRFPTYTRRDVNECETIFTYCKSWPASHDDNGMSRLAFDFITIFVFMICFVALKKCNLGLATCSTMFGFVNFYESAQDFRCSRMIQNTWPKPWLEWTKLSLSWLNCFITCILTTRVGDHTSRCYQSKSHYCLLSC